MIEVLASRGNGRAPTASQLAPSTDSGLTHESARQGVLMRRTAVAVTGVGCAIGLFAAGGLSPASASAASHGLASSHGSRTGSSWVIVDILRYLSCAGDRAGPAESGTDGSRPAA